MFVAEGPHLVNEATAAGLVCRGVICDSEKQPPLPHQVESNDCYEVPSKIFEGLVDTVHSQGVLGVYQQPDVSWPDCDRISHPTLLVLDKVQDPGNVGTALRSAAALGCVGALVLKGSADVWSAKVLRASAGVLFRFPVMADLELNQAVEFLLKRNYTVWVAGLDGDPLQPGAVFPERLALVVGNENHGSQLDWLQLAITHSVCLPMQGQVDSLNVGMAVAALLGIRWWQSSSSD